MDNPNHPSVPDPQGKAIGGIARAKSLSADRRREIAIKANKARWKARSDDDLPVAIAEAVLEVGDREFECAILPDETRLLSERAFARAIGSKRGGSHWIRMRANPDGANLPVFLSAANLKPFISNELASALSSPVLYRTENRHIAHGIRAELIPKILEVWLKARDAGKLTKRQQPFAALADILIRGFATTGIIALIDEATGYQGLRARDALARILEAFVAKELKAWVRTFSPDYYEQIFRLRKLDFKRDSVRRPQYFGILTNEIVYKRLAPGVLDELKRVTPKDEAGRPRHKFFQRLTSNIGYPKLKEHLGSVVTIMKLSNSWDDFMQKLNRLHPRYGDTMSLPFEYNETQDSGSGF